jgi:hypothetical protein
MRRNGRALVLFAATSVWGCAGANDGTATRPPIDAGPSKGGGGAIQAGNNAGSFSTAAGTAGVGGASVGGAGAGGVAGAPLDTNGGAGASAASGGGSAGNPGSTTPSGSKKAYLCNIVIGVSVTYDWFTSGFENGVDNARWEAIGSPKPGIAFIQNWADPNDAMWRLPKTSPCAQNADTPDRVIFTGVNWTYKTDAQWVTAFEAAIATLQMKFKGLKEIDLMTMLRSPNDVSCGNFEEVVDPAIDRAIKTVVGNHPALVAAAPKFYAPSCDIFSVGAHFKEASKPVVAKLYSDYYSTEP